MTVKATGCGFDPPLDPSDVDAKRGVEFRH